MTPNNVILVLHGVPYEYDKIEILNCLYIPTSVINKICTHCMDEEQQRNQLVHYWINWSPYASWSLLLGRLLWLEMENALKLAKKYFRRAPGNYKQWLREYNNIVKIQ